MDPASAFAAFFLAAALLTITPGADTALVLRTAAVEGERSALLAGAGIVSGVLAWGLMAAFGIGGVLAVSELGYRVLQYAGAAYLGWLGLRLIRGALRPQAPSAAADPSPRPTGGWYWRGLLTNLLNPKVGLFYISLLPQFIPPGGSPLLYGTAFSAVHAGLGLVWFFGLTRALRPLAALLQRPPVMRSLDGATGALFVALGLGLALSRRD
ncbi:MAG: threonine transporter RhtB [Rhizobiales bacterium 35-68-8]|nr:MAG: threonine transporter RhtB [Rhizobiales bacterium 35-68-8]